MIEQNIRVAKIEAAQYHMLLAMYEAQAVTSASPAQFLDSISASCRPQKASDLILSAL
jgi:hypothetical protein